MDVDPPALGTLTINGVLLFDEARAESLLEAKNIWIFQGEMHAGTASEPFPGKITIRLLGNQ